MVSSEGEGSDLVIDLLQGRGGLQLNTERGLMEKRLPGQTKSIGGIGCSKTV